MAKTIVKRIDRNLARRLRDARQETGLSARAVAALMPKRVAVSYGAITAYERGTTVPPVDVLAALADVYRRPINWFLDSRESLTAFQFRNLGSRVPVSELRQFEALAGKWAEAYAKLRRHLNVSSARREDTISEVSKSSPADLATSIRGQWGLKDDQPIHNTVAVLEDSFAALALELRASFGIDGAAARRGQDAVVVFNPLVNNDRLRMNVAHEIAHLLVHRNGDTNGPAFDKFAYTFAMNLLIPESQLHAAFKGKSFLQLIQYKERFGVSLAAMIYRAEQLKIINTTTARMLWTDMARRGWKNNEPGHVWRDRAIAFETMLESAIQSKAMSWSDAERITGIREHELRQRLSDVADWYVRSDHQAGEEGRKSQLRLLSFEHDGASRDG